MAVNAQAEADRLIASIEQMRAAMLEGARLDPALLEEVRALQEVAQRAIDANRELQKELDEKTALLQQREEKEKTLQANLAVLSQPKPPHTLRTIERFAAATSHYVAHRGGR